MSALPVRLRLGIAGDPHPGGTPTGARPVAIVELFQGAEVDLLVRGVVSCLPARVDLRCAKIAGDELLFQLPFVPPRGLRYAGSQDVGLARPGDLIYWPERQMLALFFGQKERETASVVALGTVVCGLPALQQVGERVQQGQGAGITIGVLEPEGMAPAVDWPSGGEGNEALPGWLRRERVRMWRQPPAGLLSLLRQRGIMRPAGPLLYAESETRKLHEWLWVLREQWGEPPVDALAALLHHCSRRLAGFSGLDEEACFLAQAAAWLVRHPELAWLVVDELLLYVGRLNGWLDLCIPWQRFHMAMGEVADRMARSLVESFGLPAHAGPPVVP